MTRPHMRSLISDGCLKRLVTVSAPGGRVAKMMTKKGPTGVITTTTSDLHPENETRMFAIHIDESQETTRRVMMALAKEAEAPGKPGVGDWVAFQKWLKSRDANVVVPFATSLSELIPSTALRLRRDFGNLITMIKTHALIHQKTRKRSSEGAVIAEIKDYDAVRKLLGRPLAETVERSVPKLVRETVKAVKGLKKHHVMIIEVATALKVNKSTALHRLKKATKAGYLVNGESRKSYPAKIGLGEPLPEDQDFLPSAKKLAQHHAARMAKLKVQAKTNIPKTNGVVAQQSA